MPAFYAHSRFGASVEEQMEGDLKQIIQKYRRQFEIGLQGPDLYFFYKAYGSNPVSEYGMHLHGISAYPFFQHGIKVIRKMGRDTKEYAYFMGFLCHFILDSECHPYVEKMIGETGVGHMEIEEEYEKLLLRMDGHNPFTYPIANRVPTDMETAQAITKFYQPMDRHTVRGALKWLKFVKQLFTQGSPWMQKLINCILMAMGKYEKYKGVMNLLEDNKKCEESNQGLLMRMNAAEEVAVKMLYHLDRCITEGEILSERFERTFD